MKVSSCSKPEYEKSKRSKDLNVFVESTIQSIERLESRGILLDKTCQMCQGGVETICHVLFGCTVTRQMLDLANVPLPVGGYSLNSLV